MRKIELRKENGLEFLEVERMPANSYVLANWIGLQSLGTVMTGGAQLLAMMKERPYQKLLNCNQQVVGPWQVANDWKAQEWVPQMTSLGLRYLAHVIGAGIYAQKSIEQLVPRIESLVTVKLFESKEKAIAWLQQTE